jgi:hypothetical protein
MQAAPTHNAVHAAAAQLPGARRIAALFRTTSCKSSRAAFAFAIGTGTFHSRTADGGEEVYIRCLLFLARNAAVRIVRRFTESFGWRATTLPSIL